MDKDKFGVRSLISKGYREARVIKSGVEGGGCPVKREFFMGINNSYEMASSDKIV